MFAQSYLAWHEQTWLYRGRFSDLLESQKTWRTCQRHVKDLFPSTKGIKFGGTTWDNHNPWFFMVLPLTFGKHPPTRTHTHEHPPRPFCHPLSGARTETVASGGADSPWAGIQTRIFQEGSLTWLEAIASSNKKLVVAPGNSTTNQKLLGWRPSLVG